MKTTRSTLAGIYELPCGCVLRATTDRLEILERWCREYQEFEGDMPHDLLWRGHIHSQLPEASRRLTVEYFEDKDD